MASNKEVLYRVLLEDGQHLVSSKDHPDLFRGISFDSNNLNPHFPELEAVEIDHRDGMSLEDAGMIAIGLGLGYLGIKTVKWGYNKFFKKKEDKNEAATNSESENDELNEIDIEAIQPETIIGKSLANQYQVYYDMSPEEFESCVMDIIYHMIAIANDLRYMANKRIYREAESKEQFKQLKSEFKRDLVKGLTANLDHLLSSEDLVFDEATNQKLNDLLGGGYIKDNEYVPVKFKKVNDALYLEQKKNFNHQNDNEKTE